MGRWSLWIGLENIRDNPTTYRRMMSHIFSWVLNRLLEMLFHCCSCPELNSENWFCFWFGESTKLTGAHWDLGKGNLVPHVSIYPFENFLLAIILLGRGSVTKAFSCEKWTFLKFGVAFCGDFSYSTFVAVSFPAEWKVNYQRSSGDG